MSLTWQEVVGNYIVRYSREIQKTTQPLKEHFGVEYFTYHRIRPDGHYTVLVDRPDWAEHYVEKQIYLNDPFLRDPSNYRSGICSVLSPYSKEGRARLLKEESSFFNLSTGLMLVEKTEDYVEFFGCAAAFDQDEGVLDLYLNKQGLLHSFASYFKQELSSFIEKMEREPIFLPVIKGNDFYTKNPISADTGRQTSFLKALKQQTIVQRAALLSSREQEVLQALIKGKTAQETAIELSLSRRTVESYLDNSKNKLGCFTKQELFSLATQLNDWGLISP